MKRYFPYIKKGGFTLIETLVAVTVLLFVIVGPMTMAQKGIQNAYYANEQLTAVFLAQEAIEAVRQLRDEQGLDVYVNGASAGTTDDWYSSLDGDCKNSNSGCAYDSVDGVMNSAFKKCSDSSVNGCVLKVASSTGKYNYSGSTNSPFTRKIFVGQQNSGDGGHSITVKVSWYANILGGKDKEIVLQTWVYDRYNRFEP